MPGADIATDLAILTHRMLDWATYHRLHATDLRQLLFVQSQCQTPFMTHDVVAMLLRLSALRPTPSFTLVMNKNRTWSTHRLLTYRTCTSF